MSKSSLEHTLKNCKPNNLLAFSINNYTVSIVKYLNGLDGGLFEMSINDKDWIDGVGYLTMNEVLLIVNSLKK